jgi:deoxyribonuclease-4
VIRFGPAGIPLSCKGRTLRDGIADVHHLGLSAMEVQFIKVNPLTRVVLDEEVGKTSRELPLQLVVEVGAPGKDPTGPSSPDLKAPLKRRATVTALTWSLAKDYTDLGATRALAKALDVDLTLHAPYYVDFFGSAESRDRSIRQIQWAGMLAEGLGARACITHLGFYGAGPRADSIQELTRMARELSDWIREYSDGSVRLGVEPSGHPDVFGSREEVLELAHQVRGVIPVLNLPHLAARERTNFEDAEKLEPVVRDFVEASRGDLYLNFSGVEFYGPGEFRLTPIKRGQLRFDALAELFSERDYDASVISSSPLLEHDAMYMKLLYERALTRRWTKRHGPAAAPAGPTTPGAVRTSASSAGARRAVASPARPAATARKRAAVRPVAVSGERRGVATARERASHGPARR